MIEANEALLEPAPFTTTDSQNGAKFMSYVAAAGQSRLHGAGNRHRS